MNEQAKEPFFVARFLNLFLGIAILALVIARIVMDDGKEIYEILIFSLAAIENFIGATISFSQQKKVRGNIYAIICAVFLIVALILAVRFFGIL